MICITYRGAQAGMLVQVAKKHSREMPIEGSLSTVATAAKVSVSAMQAELGDLGTSCAQLQRLLDSLSQAGADAFVEVGPVIFLITIHTILPWVLDVECAGRLRGCSAGETGSD